jgi:non-heme chloroperoxidase
MALPVVLLHGSFGSGACFKSQAQILAEQYDVIVLDQRSHGESEKVPFGMKIARLSKDLFELITAWELGPLFHGTRQNRDRNL